MAARRLIAILVVLLVVSSIAAALAPEARRAGTTTDTTTSTSQTTTTGASGGGGSGTGQGEGASPAPAGALVERTVNAERTGKQAAKIAVTAGDRLVLRVPSANPRQIEIPGVGQIEYASANAPARFDLLLREPGSYAVRASPGGEIAEIVVSAARRQPT